jgi:hypothetical protein
MPTWMRILAASGLLALATALACESSGTPPADTAQPADAVADTPVPADPGPRTDLDAVTGATKLMLDDTHDGWQKAACWDCHTADDHDDGKDPYLCVGCHGNNGAPAGHGGESPCSGCHAPPPHGAEGFPDPLSCRGCHGS